MKIVQVNQNPENQQKLTKAKVSTETAWGMSFLALSMAMTSAEISASNSSSFSYSSFVKTADDEQRAREAIQQSIIWSTVGSIAVGAMAYIATGKDWRWAAGTFLAGEIVLWLHIWHFDTILKENRVRYGYTYPPP